MHECSNRVKINTQEIIILIFLVQLQMTASLKLRLANFLIPKNF